LYIISSFIKWEARMADACGIDFGTSNSTVGWSRPGQPALLALEEGKPTLPSVVFFNADENNFSYGRAALANYLAGYDGRLMRSLKSLLGSGLIDEQTAVGGHALPFRELLSQFIGELKTRGERAAGRQFNRAVFGRPVFFVDDNPAADKLAEDTLADIAQSVGFSEITFQYEPIAAAFDYESTIAGEQLVLVADIGGGTSDFTLVRLSPERARKTDRRDDILATGGVHIGGTDFDKYLSLASVMPLLGLGSRLRNGSEVPSSYYFNLATWHTINLLYTPRTRTQLRDVAREVVERDKFATLLRLVEHRSGHWLAMRVEAGKIALSDADRAILNLDRLSPPQTLEIRRDQFDHSIAHLLASVDKTVNGLLRDAGVAASQIDSIFFTGGSSGIHSLRHRIAALAPGARQVEGDLFGSIGAGLALDAIRKFG
jgi:hypothetical chaperone protein